MRAYEKGDEYKIFELWKAVYPEERRVEKEWLRWWRWKYRENPAGPSSIFLAECEGTVVGHDSFIPVDVKLDDKIVKVLQNVDLMTHPAYLHRGVFSSLERQALDETRKAGFYFLTFLMGTSEVAYRGHLRRGYFDVGTMRLLLKPLNWSNAIQTRVHRKWLSTALSIPASAFEKLFLSTESASTREDADIGRISTFDARVNPFWDRICGQYKIMTVKSDRYLNWRFGAMGDYRILAAQRVHEILGYVVLKHERLTSGTSLSHILDLVAQSDDVMDCLVSSAVQDCRSMEVDMILYQSLSNKSCRNVLKRRGFVPVPFFRGGRFCAFSSSPSISKNFLRNPDNWLVQIGDSDWMTDR